MATDEYLLEQFSEVSMRAAWFEGFCGHNIGLVISSDEWKEDAERKLHLVRELQGIVEAEDTALVELLENEPTKFHLIEGAVGGLAENAFYQRDLCQFVVAKMRKARNSYTNPTTPMCSAN
jgi:hypothetical protein